MKRYDDLDYEARRDFYTAVDKAYGLRPVECEFECSIIEMAYDIVEQYELEFPIQETYLAPMLYMSKYVGQITSGAVAISDEVDGQPIYVLLYNRVFYDLVGRKAYKDVIKHELAHLEEHHHVGVQSELTGMHARLCEMMGVWDFNKVLDDHDIDRQWVFDQHP